MFSFSNPTTSKASLLHVIPLLLLLLAAIAAPKLALAAPQLSCHAASGGGTGVLNVTGQNLGKATFTVAAGCRAIRVVNCTADTVSFPALSNVSVAIKDLQCTGSVGSVTFSSITGGSVDINGLSTRMTAAQTHHVVYFADAVSGVSNISIKRVVLTLDSHSASETAHAYLVYAHSTLTGDSSAGSSLSVCDSAVTGNMTMSGGEVDLRLLYTIKLVSRFDRFVFSGNKMEQLSLSASTIAEFFLILLNGGLTLTGTASAAIILRDNSVKGTSVVSTGSHAELLFFTSGAIAGVSSILVDGADMRDCTVTAAAGQWARLMVLPFSDGLKMSNSGKITINNAWIGGEMTYGATHVNGYSARIFNLESSSTSGVKEISITNSGIDMSKNNGMQASGAGVPAIARVLDLNPVLSGLTSITAANCSIRGKYSSTNSSTIALYVLFVSSTLNAGTVSVIDSEVATAAPVIKNGPVHFAGAVTDITITIKNLGCGDVASPSSICVYFGNATTGGSIDIDGLRRTVSGSAAGTYSMVRFNGAVSGVSGISIKGIVLTLDKLSTAGTTNIYPVYAASTVEGDSSAGSAFNVSDCEVTSKSSITTSSGYAYLWLVYTVGAISGFNSVVASGNKMTGVSVTAAVYSYVFVFYPEGGITLTGTANSAIIMRSNSARGSSAVSTGSGWAQIFLFQSPYASGKTIDGVSSIIVDGADMRDCTVTAASGQWARIMVLAFWSTPTLTLVHDGKISINNAWIGGEMMYSGTIGADGYGAKILNMYSSSITGIKEISATNCLIDMSKNNGLEASGAGVNAIGWVLDLKPALSGLTSIAATNCSIRGKYSSTNSSSIALYVLFVSSTLNAGTVSVIDSEVATATPVIENGPVAFVGAVTNITITVKNLGCGDVASPSSICVYFGNATTGGSVDIDGMTRTVSGTTAGEYSMVKFNDIVSGVSGVSIKGIVLTLDSLSTAATTDVCVVCAASTIAGDSSAGSAFNVSDSAATGNMTVSGGEVHLRFLYTIGLVSGFDTFVFSGNAAEQLSLSAATMTEFFLILLDSGLTLTGAASATIILRDNSVKGTSVVSTGCAELRLFTSNAIAGASNIIIDGADMRDCTVTAAAGQWARLMVLSFTALLKMSNSGRISINNAWIGGEMTYSATWAGGYGAKTLNLFSSTASGIKEISATNSFIDMSKNSGMQASGASVNALAAVLDLNAALRGLTSITASNCSIRGNYSSAASTVDLYILRAANTLSAGTVSITDSEIATAAPIIQSGPVHFAGAVSNTSITIKNLGCGDAASPSSICVYFASTITGGSIDIDGLRRTVSGTTAGEYSMVKFNGAVSGVSGVSVKGIVLTLDGLSTGGATAIYPVHAASTVEGDSSAGSAFNVSDCEVTSGSSLTTSSGNALLHFVLSNLIGGFETFEMSGNKVDGVALHGVVYVQFFLVYPSGGLVLTGTGSAAIIFRNNSFRGSSMVSTGDGSGGGAGAVVFYAPYRGGSDIAGVSSIIVDGADMRDCTVTAGSGQRASIVVIAFFYSTKFTMVGHGKISINNVWVGGEMSLNTVSGAKIFQLYRNSTGVKAISATNCLIDMSKNNGMQASGASVNALAAVLDLNAPLRGLTSIAASNCSIRGKYSSQNGGALLRVLYVAAAAQSPSLATTVDKLSIINNSITCSGVKVAVQLKLYLVAFNAPLHANTSATITGNAIATGGLSWQWGTQNGCIIFFSSAGPDPQALTTPLFTLSRNSIELRGRASGLTAEFSVAVVQLVFGVSGSSSNNSGGGGGHALITENRVEIGAVVNTGGQNLGVYVLTAASFVNMTTVFVADNEIALAAGLSPASTYRAIATFGVLSLNHALSVHEEEEEQQEETVVTITGNSIHGRNSIGSFTSVTFLIVLIGGVAGSRLDRLEFSSNKIYRVTCRGEGTGTATVMLFGSYGPMRLRRAAGNRSSSFVIENSTVTDIFFSNFDDGVNFLGLAAPLAAGAYALSNATWLNVTGLVFENITYDTYPAGAAALVQMLALQCDRVGAINIRDSGLGGAVLRSSSSAGGQPGVSALLLIGNAANQYFLSVEGSITIKNCFFFNASFFVDGASGAMSVRVIDLAAAQVGGNINVHHLDMNGMKLSAVTVLTAVALPTKPLSENTATISNVAIGGPWLNANSYQQNDFVRVVHGCAGYRATVTDCSVSFDDVTRDGQLASNSFIVLDVAVTRPLPSYINVSGNTISLGAYSRSGPHSSSALSLNVVRYHSDTTSKPARNTIQSLSVTNNAMQVVRASAPGGIEAALVAIQAGSSFEANQVELDGNTFFSKSLLSSGPICVGAWRSHSTIPSAPKMHGPHNNTFNYFAATIDTEPASITKYDVDVTCGSHAMCEQLLTLEDCQTWSNRKLCKWCPDSQRCVQPTSLACGCNVLSQAECKFSSLGAAGACRYCQMLDMCLEPPGVDPNLDSCSCSVLNASFCEMTRQIFDHNKSNSGSGGCKFCAKSSKCADADAVTECGCDGMPLDQCSWTSNGGGGSTAQQHCAISPETSLCYVNNSVSQCRFLNQQNCSSSFFSTAANSKDQRCHFCRFPAVNTARGASPASSHCLPLSSGVSVYNQTATTTEQTSCHCGYVPDEADCTGSAPSCRWNSIGPKNIVGGKPYCSQSSACTALTCQGILSAPACNASGCAWGQGGGCVPAEGACFAFILDGFLPMTMLQLVVGVVRDVLVLFALGAFGDFILRPLRRFWRQRCAEASALEDRADETIYILDDEVKDGVAMSFEEYVQRVTEKFFSFESNSSSQKHRAQLNTAVAFAIFDQRLWIDLSDDGGDYSRSNSGEEDGAAGPAAVEEKTATKNSVVVSQPAGFSNASLNSEQRLRQQETQVTLFAADFAGNARSLQALVHSTLRQAAKFRVYVSTSRYALRRIAANTVDNPSRFQLLFYSMGILAVVSVTLYAVFLEKGNYTLVKLLANPQAGCEGEAATSSTGNSSSTGNTTAVSAAEPEASTGAIIATAFLLACWRICNASTSSTGLLVMVKVARAFWRLRSSRFVNLSLSEQMAILQISQSMMSKVLLTVYFLLLMPFLLVGVLYGLPSGVALPVIMPLAAGAGILLLQFGILRFIRMRQTQSTSPDATAPSETNPGPRPRREESSRTLLNRLSARTLLSGPRRTPLTAGCLIQEAADSEADTIDDPQRENGDNADLENSAAAVNAAPSADAAAAERYSDRGDGDAADEEEEEKLPVVDHSERFTGILSDDDSEIEEDEPPAANGAAPTGGEEQPLLGPTSTHSMRSTTSSSARPKTAAAAVAKKKKKKHISDWRRFFFAVASFLIQQEFVVVVLLMVLQLCTNATCLLHFAHDFGLEERPPVNYPLVYEQDWNHRSVRCMLDLLSQDVSKLASDLSSVVPMM